MVKALEKLHGTQQWKEALVKNGWTDAFQTGAQFEQFLKDQDERVSSTLTELGLL
jgi:putative tricarboxylic transport membrane protein